MQQTESESTFPSNANTPEESPEEVTHVPLWVKGIVATGAIIFAIQMPGFGTSLSDAILKNRGEKAFESAQYSVAIDCFEDLHVRYPSDHDLTKRLGFSYYRAGQYINAIEKFSQIEGEKLPKREVDKINAAMADMVVKLNPETR